MIMNDPVLFALDKEIGALEAQLAAAAACRYAPERVIADAGPDEKPGESPRGERPITADDGPEVAAMAARYPGKSAPERIAEILERFFLDDARLTTELLADLARCSAQDLVKLFGMPGDHRAPVVSVSAAPVAEEALTGGTLRTLPEPALPPTAPLKKGMNEREMMEAAPRPVWDANGKRLNPSRSVFPRQLRYAPGRPRGTTWLSD